MHVSYAECMPALQIRDIPEDVHLTLKVRAATAGQSLSEYALSILRTSTEKPTLAEFRERIRRRGPLSPDIKSGEITAMIRAERESR
jgi:plasmid stability protein